MPKTTLLILVSAALVTSLGMMPSASARNFRVSQLPNGGQFSCGLCHEGGASGAPRNAFGAQVEEQMQGDANIASANVVWAGLVNLDADGDGFTNGEELGDPEGAWRIGEGQPQRSTSDPNDPNATPDPCGNGIIEENESCDREIIGDATCQSQGFVGGTLLCAIDCNFDVTGCSNCGDGIKNGNEICDGTDFGDLTCQSEGFGRGELQCNDNCTLDTALCSNCGNDLRDGTEICDGADLDGQTCLSLGYSSGALSCNFECTFDTQACEGDPDNVCGDNNLGGDEACDGDMFAGETCQSQGFGSGEIACRVDCTLDTSECSLCGNNVLDEGEECDEGNLNAQTCQGLGFESGALGCNDCAFDTSNCEEAMPDPEPDAGPGDMQEPEQDQGPTEDTTPQPDMDEEDQGQPDLPEVEDMNTGEPDTGTSEQDQGADTTDEPVPLPTAEESTCAVAAPTGAAPGAGPWAAVLALLGLGFVGRRKR